MRLCFVCSEYPPSVHGGIGTVTQILARALRARGHEVRVVGVYGADHPGLDHEEDHGVQVWRLREPARTGGWVTARYRLFQTIRGWVRAGAVDLVEVPDWSGWSAGWRRLGVPVVVRLHGSATYFGAELGQAVPAATRWLEWRSLRDADFRCSVSQYTARRTEELFRLRRPIDAVLYNPVEATVPADPQVRSRSAVIFSGTLTAKKGVLTLSRAWPDVVARVPGAELHMYGKDCPTPDGGSTKAELQRLLAGAGTSVHWHGHVLRPELLEALRTARAAVFPSYVEALGMAPLEAMACGCATVFSSRGPGPELGEHGSDLLLVDPDHAGEIADALVRLLTDDALAARLGAAGRACVRERFAVGRLAEDNERFFRACLERAAA